jgi:hypothetical protein
VATPVARQTGVPAFGSVTAASRPTGIGDFGRRRNVAGNPESTASGSAMTGSRGEHGRGPSGPRRCSPRMRPHGQVPSTRRRTTQATAEFGGVRCVEPALLGRQCRKRAHPPELALTGEKLNEPSRWQPPQGVCGRKVRAPQSRVLANGQSGRPAGKCHRKQTAVGASRR